MVKFQECKQLTNGWEWSFNFSILKVLFFAVSEQSCYITAHITCISSHTTMVFTNTSDCGCDPRIPGGRLGSAVLTAPFSCCIGLGSINATCFKRWFSSKYFVWFYAFSNMCTEIYLLAVETGRATDHGYQPAILWRHVSPAVVQ